MSGLDPSTPEHTAGPRRIWRRIFVCTGAATTLLIAGVAYRVHQRSRLENQITIGPETTVVSGPLAPDGLIDYVGALNEQLSAGVTPDNNAVVPLIEALGPQIIGAPHRTEYFRRLGIPPPPATGDYVIHPGSYFQQHHEQFEPGFVDEREAFFADLEEIQGRLWLPDEFPEHAALLDLNAAPLDRIVEATKRPRFYGPIVGSTIQSALLPVQQECRTAVDLLTARSMRRAAGGDVDGAWSDVSACHRLAALVGQGGTMIDYLIAVAFDAKACKVDVALAQSQRLTAESVMRCQADLSALAPIGEMARIIDSGERLSLLDSIQTQIRDSAAASPMEASEDWLTNAGMDWNIVMRLCNGHFDKLTAVMRIDDYSERTRALQGLVVELDRLAADSATSTDIRLAAIFGMTAEVSTHAGHSISGFMISAFAQSSLARARADARRQLVRTAFALAAFHADHSAFPATLDELVPAYLREVPPDPFIASALHYERRAPDDYRLYSVGENMTDDRGLTHDSTPRGDDILVATPQPANNGHETAPAGATAP